MPKKDLKWFYWTDDGKQDEIGAIPDLIFIRYADGSDDPEQIVLVDAKNRTWTFNHMEPIKNEIVQQIYIHDNFITLFKDQFCSMLVAIISKLCRPENITIKTKVVMKLMSYQ